MCIKSQLNLQVINSLQEIHYEKLKTIFSTKNLKRANEYQELMQNKNKNMGCLCQ